MSELDEEIEAQIILKVEMMSRAEGIRWFCNDVTASFMGICEAQPLGDISYEEWMSYAPHGEGQAVAIGIISALCPKCGADCELMNGRLEPTGSVKIWNSETEKLMPRRK